MASVGAAFELEISNRNKGDGLPLVSFSELRKEVRDVGRVLAEYGRLQAASRQVWRLGGSHQLLRFPSNWRFPSTLASFALPTLAIPGGSFWGTILPGRCR